ncbi:hypothetical protein [Natronorubrum sediminis]|nr:hypothetical protein [Natronorubrum sediminis]
MEVGSFRKRAPDPPNSVGLRITFFVLWAMDTIAATLFFVVPHATELNPVTVFFYHVFGLPGVVLAAACYAALVVFIGHILSDPLDIKFVGLVVLLYIVFVTNNVLLLVFHEPLPEFLGV